MASANGTVLYRSYTYDHPNILVRFPHRKRFNNIKRIIRNSSVSRWLDYGCGDAEMYRLYSMEPDAPRETVLYEPADGFADQALTNVGVGPAHRVVRNLAQVEGEFDLITALEVLEHLPLPERILFFQTCARVLAPNGRIILEVPVEVGPTLLLKEWGRRILKGRKSDYTTVEVLESAFLGKVRDVHDRYNPNDTRTVIAPHHGFDTFRFQRELRSIGKIKSIVNSPLPQLPVWLNQCRIYEFELLSRDPDEIAARLTPAKSS